MESYLKIYYIPIIYYFLLMLRKLFRGRHDIQLNDIQLKDTDHNDIQHNRLHCDTQHNDTRHLN